ncbi:MAG: LURP-one-related family protein [Clostridia bacterium]|nr:LURP-one-related family protein [Clostridia bacterium]
MKLLFKQRFFSWLDSYDIFDETGCIVYTVKGRVSWGHKLQILDADGYPLGMVKEQVFRFLPRFDFYEGEAQIGTLKKEFTFFRPSFTLDFNGWQVEGNWTGWDYSITDAQGFHVAAVTKELWNWTDTYCIDVADPRDALYCLMIVLAIDAEKCSSSK